MIELFRNRRNSKSSWQRFISEGSRILSDQLGGAGHFFGHDNTETRDPMYEVELKLVLRLLAAGEKKINFKEREFRARMQIHLILFHLSEGEVKVKLIYFTSLHLTFLKFSFHLFSL